MAMSMGYQMVTWPTTSHDPKGQTRDLNRLRGWRNISKTAGDAILQQSLITR